MNISEKVLVLLSGGQDSATCLAIAQTEFLHVETLGFYYGQRHQIELEQAKSLAKMVQVPFEILDLSLLSQLTHNSLTHSGLKIETKPGELPNTFVDGRNMLFLTFAAIYAKQKGIHYIYTGVCQTDYSGYPDCRDDFIQSLNQTLNLAMEYPFQIVTPLMWLTKAQTVQRMQELGRLDWYRMTHTCYEGMRPPCGKCPACLLRQKGFDEAGVVDPLLTIT